jgi:FG-GAP-like repeat
MKLIRITQNSTFRFVAKTFLSIATTLLLLLSARSSVFASSATWKLNPTSGDGNTVPNRPSDDPIFTDATVSAGLNTAPGYTFGDPIWGDFDGDGDLDLFVDNHYVEAPYLYQNNGNGTFTDILSTSGINQFGDKHGSAWVDFDNDGDLDLSITKGADGGQSLGHKKDELYLDLGAGRFKNIATAAGVVNTFGRGRSVAWGDFNKDGYPDLLLGNLQTDLVLLKNNGNKTFTDVTVQAGLAHLQYIECVFADYNNDGFPDIFCTDSQRHLPPTDILLKNNGDGTFTNVSTQAGMLPLIDGRSIAWGDYDNDGDLDLFISRGLDNRPLKQTLYRNNGDGTFTDVTDQAGLGSLSNNRAAAWGDFNNDGYLDLYVVNSGSDPGGKGPNYLYRNNQDGTFTDVADSAGVQVLVASRGRGAAWGDYDNDGSLIYSSPTVRMALNLQVVPRFSTVMMEMVITGLRLYWWEQRVTARGWEPRSRSKLVRQFNTGKRMERQAIFFLRGPHRFILDWVRLQ